MDRNKWIIVAVVIVIIGAWFLFKGTPAQAPAVAPVESQTSANSAPLETTNPAASAVTITYTDSGFSPKAVTVAQGTTVTFVNQSSKQMWVGSAPHPTHEGYDGTTEKVHCASGYTGPAPFDECSFGTSFSFTFTKAGTWGYHNHASSADWGTVTVTAPTPI
jgi:plastocyanin